MRRSIEGWWRVVVLRSLVLLAGLLLATALPGWAIATTAVSDTVYRADGTPAQGTLLVSWPSFTAADGSAVAAGSTTVTIAAGGGVQLQLTPNDGASPAGTYYTAVYHLSDGTVQKEFWVVPQLPTATIAMMRSKVVPAVVAQPIVSQQSVSATVQSTVANYLPLKGGALTGSLNLAGDPQSNLQAATKQYVDAHGGGIAVLPTGIVYGQGSTGARASTAGDLTSLFHSAGAPVTTTSTILNTAFTEKAAGTALNGTAPAAGSGAVWSATSIYTYATGGGLTATGNATNNLAVIDTGTTNYTVTYHGLANYLSAAQMVLKSDQAASFAAGAHTVLLEPSGANPGVYYCTNSGSLFCGLIGSISLGSANTDVVASFTSSTVTVTAFGGTTVTLAFPTSDTLLGTLVGLNVYGNGVTTTLARVNATASTVTTPVVACAGFLKSDGTCYTPAVNHGVASDSAGNLTVLAEKETKTDASGVTRVACEEDLGMGRFDSRCSKYGNGGIFGATPGVELQALADTLVCYEATTGKAPTVYFPSGVFPVGTPTHPALVFPTGGYYSGVAGRNGNVGTVFQATYNNHNALQWNSGQTAVCADGVTRTANLTGGSYVGISEHGCGQGGCVNVPTESGDFPNGGPNQNGIFIGDNQGYAHNISANNNGASGVICDGQDTICDGLWGYNNTEWYVFGRQNAGQVYDPSTDGLHCDVVLSSLDGQFSNIETYGFQTPGSGVEYGHVCGVDWGGGNSSLDHVFAQTGEIGVIVNTSAGKLSNFRIEATRGEGLVIPSGGNEITNGEIHAACRGVGAAASVAATPASQGGRQHCDYIDDYGGGNHFSNISIGTDPFFGADSSTGGIWPYVTSIYDVTVAGSGSDGKLFETPVSYGVNQGVLEGKLFKYERAVTGPVPDCSYPATAIAPGDTAAVNYTTCGGAEVGQEITIAVPNGNANVTLLGTTRGGHWHNCTPGADVNLGAPGVLHYLVTGGTVYGDPAELTEQCDVPKNLTARPVPATSTEVCSDADFTFGAGPGTTGGFGMYRCHPANTWTFYPLTATAF